jgi:hypothetical protein
MKLAVCFSLLLCTLSAAFARTPKCPPGKVYGGGIETSDFRYAPGCYTPAQKKKLDCEFAESMCQDSGQFLWMADGTSYARDPEWKTDHCEIREEWRFKGTVVTQEQYMRLTCGQEWINGKQVYPRPDWKECAKP